MHPSASSEPVHITVGIFASVRCGVLDGRLRRPTDSLRSTALLKSLALLLVSIAN